MMRPLRPYSAYKDSGVEWLGDVPEHWTTARLKSSMNNIVEQTTERRGSDLYVALEHVESWTGRLKHAGSDVSFDSQVKRFRSGDILFGKLRPYLAKVTRSASGGVCVGEFLVLRPRHSNTTAPYMEQLLRSKPVIDAVNSSTFGAKMPRADWQFMGGMAIVHPPLPEQAAIARFLDHADRRIRRYIRAKQKLITLLEEQKQALIHRAVTRGLDPNVRLKSSGVEWLGDVPEHWAEAVKIKYVSSLKGRLGWQGLKAGEYTSEGPYIVSSAHFRNHKINWKICPHVTQERYEMDKHIQLAHGDILLMKDGAAMGKLAFVDELPGPACLNSHLLLFRPLADNGGIAYLPQFMFYYMQTEYFQGYAQVNGTGATFLGISQESIGNHTVCLPPISEQTAVVEYLNHETADLDTTTASANRQIDLLREYYTRLIADVVTGKLDVRKAAGRLPDEVEEPEPLDKTDALTDGDEEPAADLDAVPEEATV